MFFNLFIFRFIFPSAPMGRRYYLKVPSRSPGPLAYYPKFKSGPNSPAFSIRKRVGRCVKPYITPEDNCD